MGRWADASEESEWASSDFLGEISWSAELLSGYPIALKASA